ncbi:MAG: Na+/H+ antiporter NhaC family protein [Deltaproteobacteria bacterium]|nr:MAG: Na+/H+ antiporter NhaC family protein [Deltaproteobacteria bacterium]
MHPGPLSLLPVVVAVALTLWTRQVVLSLGASVFVGALLLQGGDPWAALVHTVDPLVLDAIADRDHAKVTLFSLLIGATVQVAGDAGGTRALVELVTRRARSRRSGMVVTWLAGLIVFFDDYANCLVVGTAMRPLCDRLRISREKLAYLVDSTAAPMATVALVSTWIGYEVGLMEQALEARGVQGSAYAFFLAGLPYRFYPLYALAFAGLVAATGRDFGPMLAAERRAVAAPAPADAPSTHPGLALVALLPIAALVLVTGGSLWVQGVAAVGSDARLFEIIGGADGYDAMVQGSIASATLALLASTVVGFGRDGIHAAARATRSAVQGMAELFEALVVLFLAWALGSTIGDLHTADWILDVLGGGVPPWALPTLTFLVSAAIAFATGTSFGTMAVVMPLALPLGLEGVADAATAGPIAFATGAAVLSGATWGDHCSPISDTTVLSSTGAGCDHARHVGTQLPYAIAAGVVAVVLGTLPAGLGLSAWLVLPLGVVGCWAIIRLVGRRSDGPSAGAAVLSEAPSPRS